MRKFVRFSRAWKKKTLPGEPFIRAVLCGGAGAALRG